MIRLRGRFNCGLIESLSRAGGMGGAECEARVKMVFVIGWMRGKCN